MFCDKNGFANLTKEKKIAPKCEAFVNKAVYQIAIIITLV